MAVFQFSEKRGKLYFTPPSGGAFQVFETDGDLVAEDGTGSDHIRVKFTEDNKYLIYDVPWDDIYKDNGTTNWGTDRATTKANLNSQLFDRGLIYQLGLGQRVRNDSGATMVKGTPAVVKGNIGGVVTVEPAKASDSTKMPAVYVLLEDIADNAGGEVASYGVIKDIDTSLYSVGTKLYVAPAGTWTATEPTGTNIVQAYATVQVSSATKGQILVQNLGNDESNFPENTNIATDNLTIAGTRDINMYSSYGVLNFQKSAFVDLLSINGITGTVHVKGIFKVDSPSVSGGYIQLEEYGQSGNNYVELRAPSSLSNNISIVLPGTASSEGEVMVSDSSGNLSFKPAPYVLAASSTRVPMYWGNRYYFGSSSYGWDTDTAYSTSSSSTTLIDDYAHMGIVCPTDISKLTLKATVRNDSSAEDIRMYLFKQSRPNGSTANLALSFLAFATADCSSGQDRHYNCDVTKTNAGISAGDLIFVAFYKVSSTNATRYVNASYTLYAENT